MKKLIIINKRTGGILDAKHYCIDKKNKTLTCMMNHIHIIFLTASNWTFVINQNSILEIKDNNLVIGNQENKIHCTYENTVRCEGLTTIVCGDDNTLELGSLCNVICRDNNCITADEKLMIRCGNENSLQCGSSSMILCGYTNNIDCQHRCSIKAAGNNNINCKDCCDISELVEGDNPKSRLTLGKLCNLDVYETLKCKPPKAYAKGPYVGTYLDKGHKLKRKIIKFKK